MVGWGRGWGGGQLSPRGGVISVIHKATRGWGGRVGQLAPRGYRCPPMHCKRPRVGWPALSTRLPVSTDALQEATGGLAGSLLQATVVHRCTARCYAVAAGPARSARLPGSSDALQDATDRLASSLQEATVVLRCTGLRCGSWASVEKLDGEGTAQPLLGRPLLHLEIGARGVRGPRRVLGWLSGSCQGLGF